MAAAVGPSPVLDELDSLKRLWDSDQAELVRSERVQSQLRAVQQSLQRRCDELSAESKRLRAEAAASNPLVAACATLAQTIEAERQTLETLGARQATLAQEVEEQLRAEEASKAREADCISRLAEAAKARAGLAELRDQAEVRCREAQEEARSMVTQEALERAAAESERLSTQMVDQEAEAARLRQALADSWASRDDLLDEIPESGEGSSEDQIKALDNVEEELKWLAQMQREASTEVHRLQYLERSEASLQARLRLVSEEKAALQSTRVDLGDAGKAMREAIASQSEGYVKRVGGLAEARRFADEDRVKLMEECADLQARLDAMAPQLAGLSDVEGRHAKLEASRQLLADESQRLRDINGALGAQLMGDDAPGLRPDDAVTGVSEAVMRVLNLQRRLLERSQAQDAEREKLAERIRSLERAASKPDVPEPAAAGASRWGMQSAKKPGARAAPAPQAAGPLASATSVLKEGLGFFGI